MQNLTIKKSIIAIIGILFVASIIVLFGFQSKTNAETFEEMRFYGSGTSTTSTQILNFDRFTKQGKDVGFNFPTYYKNDSDYNSECCSIAGGNILGYYDAYINDLIPNCNNFSKYGDIVYYKSMNSEITKLINTLAVDMKTNVAGKGNTLSEFKDGMKKYVARQGHSINFESINTRSFDFNKVKNAIDNKKPVVIFTEHCTLTSIDLNNKKYNHTIYSSNHSMVAFGYVAYNYYDSNNKLIKTDYFLKVASGMIENKVSYYNINDVNSNIIFAEIPTIK